MHGSSFFAFLLSVADGATRVPSGRLFEESRVCRLRGLGAEGTREFPELHSKPELSIRNAGYLHRRMIVMFL